MLSEKNLANIRAYRDAKDPSFDDFKKALGDIKEVFATLTNFVKALDVESIHNIPELVHRLIDISMVDYLHLHFPIIYWSAQPLGFLEEPLTATIPHVMWNRFVTIFRKRGWLLDDEEQARTFSDSVFISLAAVLVILEFEGLTSSTSPEDDGDLSTLAIEPLYGWEPAPGSATPLLDKMSERTLSPLQLEGARSRRPQESHRQERHTHVAVRTQDSRRSGLVGLFRVRREHQRPHQQRLALQSHAVGDGRGLVLSS